MLRTFLAATLLALPGPAVSEKPFAYPHAQTLAESVVRGNPDLLDVILHVSPTPGTANVVVAAHLTKANGELSGADDIGVATTGAPLVEVQKDGVRLGVLVQLRDARRRSIGAIGLMYPYRAGDDVEARLRRSFAIRDELAARIPSLAALVA